jgi:hypothetical protein
MSVELVKNRFDIAAFNKDFEDYAKQRYELQKQQEIQRLKELNETIYEKKISEMTWKEIMSEWKLSLIGFLDDMINFRLSPHSLFRENRLFFIGITLLLFAIIFYLFVLIFGLNYSSNEKTFKFTLDVPILNDLNKQLNQTKSKESFWKKLFTKKPTETNR